MMLSTLFFGEFMYLLEVNSLKKVYRTRMGSVSSVALRDISFNVEGGEFIAIMGDSGSGKTTLLNLIAGLDKPTSGSIFMNGENVSESTNADQAVFRRENLGFVFQQFNLADNFSVRENILLPVMLAEKNGKTTEEEMMKIVKDLKVEDLLEKYPYELSGGEMQRVAIARAIITKPKLILADEPTGALDSRSSANILDIFEELNERGQTILMVTHSVQAASFTRRVLFIKDGELYNQIYRGSRTPEEMYKRISETLTVMSDAKIEGP